MIGSADELALVGVELEAGTEKSVEVCGRHADVKQLAAPARLTQQATVLTGHRSCDIGSGHQLILELPIRERRQGGHASRDLVAMGQIWERCER